jgi:hypothetical protein
MNREKRKELCSEVQRIVAEDVPYVPLVVYRCGERTPEGDGRDCAVADGWI